MNMDRSTPSEEHAEDARFNVPYIDPELNRIAAEGPARDHHAPAYPAPMPYDQKANPARQLIEMSETSDGWDLKSWSPSALVLTRAALRLMLVSVDRECYERQL